MHDDLLKENGCSEKVDKLHQFWQSHLFERDSDITPVMFCSSLIPGWFRRGYPPKTIGTSLRLNASFQRNKNLHFSDRVYFFGNFIPNRRSQCLCVNCPLYILCAKLLCLYDAFW